MGSIYKLFSFTNLYLVNGEKPVLDQNEDCFLFLSTAEAEKNMKKKLEEAFSFFGGLTYVVGWPRKWRFTKVS